MRYFDVIPYLTADFQASLPGHRDVGQNHVDILGTDGRHCRISVRSHRNIIIVREFQTEIIPQVRIVVRHENPHPPGILLFADIILAIILKYFRSGRKHQHETGIAGPVVQDKVTGMHPGKIPGKRQADPHSRGRLGTCLHERLEDFLPLVLRDMVAVIGNFQADLPAVRRKDDIDMGLGIFYGIQQDIVQNLAEGRLVGIDIGGFHPRAEIQGNIGIPGSVLIVENH